MATKQQIDKNTGEVLPINHGMNLRFSPMPRFYEDERGNRKFKGKLFDYCAVQISQTKVRVSVTFREKLKDGTARTLHSTGVGGFIHSKDFNWKSAVQAGLENAVAQMDFTN